MFFVGIILFFGMAAFSMADEGPAEEAPLIEEKLLIEEAEEETEVSPFREELEPKAAAMWEARPAVQKVSFNLDAGTDVRYDSNIFLYSEGDKEQFKDGTNPDRFSGVNSTYDVVTNVYAIGRAKVDFFDFGSSIGSVGVKGDICGKNPAKSYIKIQTSLRQQLGENHLLRFGYSIIPNYFVRTLYARGEPIGQRYKRAGFTSNNLHLKYWNGISDVFSWWMRYSYENKDYNKYFTDRDTNSHKLTMAMRITPEEWIKFNPYFRYFWHIARGRAGQDISFPDISRNGFDTGTGIWLFPSEPFTVIGRYDFQWANYTTSQSAVEDPYHSGRTQGRNRITAKLNYAFNKNINLFTEYVYEIRGVNVKAGSGEEVLEAEAILGYDKHIARIGTSISF